VRPPANTVYVPDTQSEPAAVNAGTENEPEVTVTGSRKTTPDGPVTWTINSGVPAGAGDALPVMVIDCPVEYDEEFVFTVIVPVVAANARAGVRMSSAVTSAVLAAMSVFILSHHGYETVKLTEYTGE